ncbi:MAG: DUF177 domain-containing protein [Prevotella sp.]|nr:DUF177 domain-containing protein [Candidatus Prevotella equi]
MFSLETMDIDLLALKEDSYEASVMLDKDFFLSLDDAQIQDGRVNAKLLIRKAATEEFTLTISVEGTVMVQCDLCLEDMEQPVKAESSYIVKLGQNPSEDEDIIIVDENEGILSTAWLVYETIVLAIPIKHVHAPGKCNDAMIKKLQELSATRSGDEIAEDTIDPRWAALAQLKN